MTAKRVDQPEQPEGKEALRDDEGPSPPQKALPKGTPQSESGQPGGGQGRIDVTGIITEGIRVDPDLTEGHPGYQESGDSEVIPPERLAGGGTAAAEGRAD